MTKIHCNKLNVFGLNIPAYVSYLNDFVFRIFLGSTEAFGIDCFFTENKINSSNANIAEKKYKCTLCPYSSDLASNTRRHMATHTGIKPYKCPQCQKAFALKQHVKDHMLTHTDERPFKCPECGQSFRRKSSLQMHQYTCHGCVWKQFGKEQLMTDANLKIEWKTYDFKVLLWLCEF